MALANVALTDTFDTWRIRTNQIIALYDQSNVATYAAFSQSNTSFDKANAANLLAYNTSIGANAWANTVVLSSNAWANTVGLSSNAWANTVVLSSNAWANTVGVAGNNYTSLVGTSGNNYTNTLVTAGNNYATSIGTAGNNYTLSVASAGNSWTNTVVTAANNYTNSQIGVVFTRANASIQNNQTTLITVGYSVSPYNAGANVAAFGTWTPNPANGNYQYANSNGAVTIAAPATDCAIDILLYNGQGDAASSNNARAITFSGFTAPASGGSGDPYDTVANNKFILSIRRINNISTYVWKALQ